MTAPGVTARLSGDGKNGIIQYPGQTFNVRVKAIMYDWEVIFTESHARSRRAMYPHQRAVGRFALTLQFNRYTEYKEFVDFIWGFIRSFANHNQAYLNMYVQVPAYNFSRTGVPIAGVPDTDHVGSMLFEPTVVFEAMDDPLDPVQLSPVSDAVSQPDTSQAGSDETQFFYPFSPASQDASLTAEKVYDPNASTPGDSAASGAGVGGLLNQASGGTVVTPPIPPQGTIPAFGIGPGHF